MGDKSSYEAFSTGLLRVEVIFHMQLSVAIRSKMSNFTIIVLQGVSGGIVSILDDVIMDYSE